MDAFCSFQDFQSKRVEASFKYAFKSVPFGTTAIMVAVSFPSGLVTRKRFTFGIPITNLGYHRLQGRAEIGIAKKVPGG